MSGPDWLDNSFAAVMVVVAVYSLGRLVAARAWSRPTHLDVDAAHVLMGVAMAGMLTATLNPIPDGAWEAVFAGVALWFVWRCWRFVARHGVEGRDEDHVHHLSHYLTHLVMASAMFYMYLVATKGVGASKHAGMAMNGATGAAADFVGIPLFFVMVLFASGIWELDGVQRFSPAFAERIGPELVVVATGVPVPVPPDGGGMEVASSVDDSCPVGDLPQRSPWLAPRLEAGCHVAMCITMGYMLILMF